MTEEAVVISVDSTDVELAAARFDQLRGASEAAAEGLDDVGAAGEDAAEGLDEAADQAERMGRQSAGATMSIGRMTAGILSGAVALQGIKAAFRLGLAAVREYAAGNADAQRQVDAVAASTREARLALGAMIIRFGEASGIAAALTATLRGLGAAMDAISGRSASGLAIPQTADALERVRAQAAAAARDVEEYQSQVDRLTDLQMAPGLRTDAVNASLEGLRERSRDLAMYQAAIAQGSQIVAQQAAANIQRVAGSIAEITGPQAVAGGGSGGAEQAKRLSDAIAAQNNARVIAEKQGIAEANAARLQGMADAIRQYGEFAEVQAQQLRDQAALELEIEASKNAALAELRAQVKEQERRDAEERRETWRGLLGDMRNMAVSAGNALSQALGTALATGDGQSLRQSFRSIFAGVLADMGTMLQTIAVPMLIPSPFNPVFNPAAGAGLLAAGFGLQALSGAFGAAGGGGGSSPVAAPSASRDIPTRSRDGGNTEIYQSLQFGFVGDRRAVIREVYDVLADGRRLGMAQ